MRQASEKGRGWILAIATFRVLKALVLLGASFGAFALFEVNVPAPVERLVDWAQVDRPPFTDHVLLGVGTGAFLDASLFLTEAYGLFRGRVWAEWLTIVATASFIPFEIVEIVRERTALRIAALVVNVLIVAFLVYRRIQDARPSPQRNTRSRGAALAQST